MEKLIEQLQSLETLDLVAKKKSEPETEYAFKHIFTQESVYKSILRTNRRQLHQQVGEALETLYAAELEEQALLLAYHFQQSDDAERALRYLKIAGDRARANFANQEARELYTQALALVDERDYAAHLNLLADREQILDRLGERERQATDLTLMQTLAELMADDTALATTHNRRSIYFDKISEYQAAAEAAQVGLHVARRSGNARLEAQSLNLLALAAWRRFDYEAVKQWANEALEALRIIGEPEARSTSLLHLARASYRLGQYDAALSFVEAVQELTQYTNNRDLDAQADLMRAWIYQRLGDYDLSEQHYQATLQKRRSIGDRYGEAGALSHLGWLACDQDRFEAGLGYCQEALEISRTIADRENEAYALSGIGLTYENLGRLAEAISNYEAALTIQSKIGATSLAIFDRAGLARIALAQQNIETAREHILVVADWINSGNAQKFWDPWIIYQSAYEVLTAVGEIDTARTILTEAHTVLQQRAEQISNPDLRHCFLEKVSINRDIEAAWQAMKDVEPA